MSAGGPKEGRARKCPDCGAMLAPVYAKANYGRVLLLDQCARCGGTWFDKWELYFLKNSSIGSLAAVGPLPGSREAPTGLGALDMDAFLGANPPGVAPGLCPLCSKPLKPFTDPGLPADASIQRCAACSGLWLNRGALTRYAEHRVARNSKKSAGLAASTPSAAGPGQGPGDAAGPGPELKTLKSLQKELDVSTLVARDYPAAFNLDAPPIEPKEFAKDVGVLILQALLRLVFKI